MGTQGTIAEIAATFGVNWPHLMAQTASFSIVCGLLYLLAYRPILRMLDLRRRQIARGIAHAEEIDVDDVHTVYRVVLVEILALSYAVRRPEGYPVAKTELLA